MRLRTFTAANVPEAMKLVRAALGPDAVIVSQRQNRPGGAVEIKAAVETPAAETPAPNPVTASEIESRLQSVLMDRLRGKPAAAAPQTANGAPWSVERLAAALAHHRLPRALATELAAAACTAAIPDVGLALAAALDKTLRFDPIPTAPERPVMLVGPAGAGKTAAVARLAARAAMAGAPLRVVTTDTLRAGGVEQLDAFVRLLGQALQTAAGPDALQAALPERGPALIDTTGCNPYAPLDLQDLRALIEAAGAEPVLVLPAGVDPAEAQDISAIFAGLGCTRLLPTRLDAARRFGGVVAAAAAGLALAQGAATPYVAQGLAPITALSLARLLTDESLIDHPHTEPPHAAR